jgi:phosphocarrier protein HPr
MSEWIADHVVIEHEVGLHARPAVKLTKLAKSFAASIEVSNEAEGPWIDAKSIVKVMAMKAKQYSMLHVRAKGADANAAVAALVDLVAGDFAETVADAAGA